MDVLKPVKAFERNISFKPSSAVLKASLSFCFWFGFVFVGPFSKDKEDTAVLCGLNLDTDHSHESVSYRVIAVSGLAISSPSIGFRLHGAEAGEKSQTEQSQEKKQTRKSCEAEDRLVTEKCPNLSYTSISFP